MLNLKFKSWKLSIVMYFNAERRIIYLGNSNTKSGIFLILISQPNTEMITSTL